MYDPLPGEKGLTVLYAATAAYLLAQTEITDWLGTPPAEAILQVGFLDDTTPRPCILLSCIGSGDTAEGEGTDLVRLIAYVIDQDRGYYGIENLLERLTKLFESSAFWEFLTFPPSVGFAVLGIESVGTTANTTLPGYDGEARGAYVQLTRLTDLS